MTDLERQCYAELAAGLRRLQLARKEARDRRRRQKTTRVRLTVHDGKPPEQGGGHDR
jgi:hypothetical protein